jgi:Amt family ammonium transporter
MDSAVIMDTIWVLVAGSLVFFMNLGFACVESGFARQKNTVNILSKNFIVFAVSSLGFLLLGWGLMFGDGNGFVGTQGLFFVSGADTSPAVGEAYQGVYSAISWTGIPLWAKFFFQLVFCGTAATIVSGAVAERIKYISFIVFSFILTLLIYPIVGHWIWGGGFLAAKGMLDFAGGTVVHSVGGWAALAGVLILGPRIGKYGKDGKIKPIAGHNLSLATIGAFVLWLGWFGFNPGSTMAAEPLSVSHIFITTNTAGIMGILTATATAWIIIGKPDLGMSINAFWPDSWPSHHAALTSACRAPCSSALSPVSLSSCPSCSLTAGGSTLPSVHCPFTSSTACSARCASVCSLRTASAM